MKIKAYKTFNHDMTCRGFQYEEGKTYEMNPDDIKICKSGFHACFFPLDCLKYYKSIILPPKYHEVEIEGVIDYNIRISEYGDYSSHGLLIENSKICGSKITIGNELSALDLLNIEKSLVFNDDEQKKFFDQFKMDKYEEKFKTMILSSVAKDLIICHTEMMTDKERETVFNDEDAERLYSYIDHIENIIRSRRMINYVMCNSFSCVKRRKSK